MRDAIIVTVWAVAATVFCVLPAIDAIQAGRLDARVAEAERRTAEIEAVVEGRECAAQPRTCSCSEIPPGREAIALAWLNVEAHPITFSSYPLCWDLRERWERREQAARRSLPVLAADEARWKRRPDRAWECIANIGGAVTSTGAGVCIERQALLACPHEGGPRYLSDEALKLAIDEGRVW